MLQRQHTSLSFCQFYLLIIIRFASVFKGMCERFSQAQERLTTMSNRVRLLYPQVRIVQG